MDERMKATIYWGAIASGVYAVITGVSSYIAVNFFVVPGIGFLGGLAPLAPGFGFGSIISSLVWGAVGGAVGGAIFAYAFDFWLKLARIIFGWLFNFQNLFQLYFYPGIVFWLLFSVLGGFLGSAFGMMFWLINAVGGLVGIYAFASLMEQGAGRYYNPLMQNVGPMQ